MRIQTLTSGRRLSISRRQFVKGLTAGGVISGLHWGGPLAFGETIGAAGPRTPEILTGNHFELSVDRLPVNFTGKKRTAVAVNESVNGPTLRWREGEVVTVAVTQSLDDADLDPLARHANSG